MLYAKIRIDEEVFNAREKSVPLEMIFRTNTGSDIIYAPKSKIIVLGEEDRPEWQTNRFFHILVPCWVFWNKGLNPCQIACGYIDTVKR